LVFTPITQILYHYLSIRNMKIFLIKVEKVDKVAVHIYCYRFFYLPSPQNELDFIDNIDILQDK